jgi:GxxExxY protein
MNKIMKLCDQVRDISYAIHVYHGNGYLEKVYENALVNRLRKAGLSVKQQCPITINDEDDTVIGEYFADIIVNNCLLVELKACKSLTNEHKSQVLH